MMTEMIEMLSKVKCDYEKIRDDNYFDIGIRGHYENPFTEVLAYLLEKTNAKIINNEFADIVLKCILHNEKMQNSFKKELYISTQHMTVNGNFIDMIVYNKEYVVTFENKIEHILINPLDDYEKEIERHYPNQIKVYILFTKHNIGNHGKWENIEIPKVFKTVRNELCSTQSKWDYFINEFLEHYIDDEGAIMTNEEYNFCEDNYVKIIKSNQMLNDYVDKVISNVNLKEACHRVKIERNWNEDGSIAIRFYPLKNSESNSVLVLRMDNKIENIVYFQPKSTHLINKIDTAMETKYRKWNEGQWSCYAINDVERKHNVGDAIEEVVNNLSRMKSIEIDFA